jgi:NTE family protein
VVNPLPFDVARDYFGGPVVAVAVHASARHNGQPPAASSVSSSQWPRRGRQLLEQGWMARAPMLREWLESQVLRAENSAPRAQPSYWTTRRVLDRVLDMAEAEIIRLRAVQNPPDLVLTPAIEGIGLLEFYRAEEAIAAGRRAAEEQLPRLRELHAQSRQPRPMAPAAS